MNISFQKGCVVSRKTKRFGLVHVIRYRAQQADGTWRQKAEVIRTPFRKEAEKVLSDRLGEINNGAKIAAEITFQQFVDEHWKSYLLSLKPATKASHESSTNKHLLPVLGHQKLKDIQPLQLQKLFASKPVMELSAKTRLNVYLLLNKMFNNAVELELIPSSPMRKLFKPTVEQKEKPALSAKQIELVIKETPDGHRALFVLLSVTGLRIGEALGLKWADIDFNNGELYIRRSIWRGKEQSPKSKSSKRKKQMGAVLVRALKWHKGMSNYTEPDDYVFTNGGGKTPDPDDLRKRVLYPAMDRAGVARTARAFGFHIFRHSAGSTLGQQENVNLKQVSSFLGHSSTAITGDVYMHLSPDVERAVAEKLESAIYAAPEVLFPNVHKMPEAVN